jgi:hypothetical protein
VTRSCVMTVTALTWGNLFCAAISSTSSLERHSAHC